MKIRKYQTHLLIRQNIIFYEYYIKIITIRYVKKLLFGFYNEIQDIVESLQTKNSDGLIGEHSCID